MTFQVMTKAGHVLFDVDADEARSMVREGDARWKDKGGVRFLEMQRQPQLPSWVFGTKYHFTEELSPGVKVTSLKPSGRRLQISPPIQVQTERLKRVGLDELPMAA